MRCSKENQRFLKLEITLIKSTTTSSGKSEDIKSLKDNESKRTCRSFTDGVPFATPVLMVVQKQIFSKC